MALLSAYTFMSVGVTGQWIILLIGMYVKEEPNFLNLAALDSLCIKIYVFF